MKEYTKYAANPSMKLECLILNPAFIKKQPRQIPRTSGQRAVSGRFDSRDRGRQKVKADFERVTLMSSEDWMVFKAMGAAAVLFIAALFL